MLLALVPLFRPGSSLIPEIRGLLAGSILASVASGTLLLGYWALGGAVGLVAHLLKIAAVFLLYRAVVETGLRRPGELLLREIREKTAALEASERLHRTLFEEAEDGIALMDPNLRPLTANRAYFTLLGFERPASPEEEELEARRTDRVHPDDRGALEAARRRVLEEGRGEAAYRVRHADGSWRWHYARGSRIDAPEGEPRILAFVQDITSLKRAEEARWRFQESLAEARRYESLGLLAGGIAHDFNNLLTIIRGRTEILRLDIPEEERELQENLDAIEEAALRASELSRHMRDYAGGISSGLEPVDANALIWDLSEALTDHLPPEVELRWDPAPDLPAILADPGQIRQVVQNLFENAREAMEGRKGRIRIATGSERPDRLLLERCSLVPRPLGGLYVRIEVSDEGCGMDEETRARMFEPFFSTKFAGRGLGLAVVRGVVRSGGGAIDVESAPGRGCRVRVWFPAAEGLAEIPRPPLPVARPRPVPEGRSLLIADDEATLRALAGAALSEEGFVVEGAEDGREALELFRRRKEEGRPFDAVVLDCVMPRLDGFETLREMRRLDPELPAILMSCYGEGAMERRIEEAHPSFYLPKPYELPRLLELARRATEARRGETSGPRTLPGAG